MEQRRCLSGIALVIPPPASTSRADEDNVGEEIERGAASKAAPLGCSPAEFADQAAQTDTRTSSQRSRHSCGVAIVIFPAELTEHEERTRRGPKPCAKRQLGAVAYVMFPAEVTTYAKKIPTTADKLGRAPRRLPSLPGTLPGDSATRPENADELETLGPSAVPGPRPAICARMYF